MTLPPSATTTETSLRPARAASLLWDRLDRLSTRLLGDIAGIGADDAAADRWYVHRDVETALLGRILQTAPVPQIVIGGAGHGKSALLWSLHRRLLEHNRKPLLISAAWLQRKQGCTHITCSDDIAEAMSGHPNSVLLLDTADLLLHSSASRHEVVDLVDRLARCGLSVVLGTRPQEGEHLPRDLGDRVTLGPYSSGSELPLAIAALQTEFCAYPSQPRNTGPARTLASSVDEVYLSPLLLRLLFSLTAPHFPHLDLEVNGLYNLFWARRIRTDQRSGPEVLDAPEDDLTGVAGLVAIAMVALGSPEPHCDDLVRRTVQAASWSGHRVDADIVHRQIRTLTRRGVLLSRNTRVRFLHHTFFEFAAAQGLAARGADAELPRLIERLVAAPTDHFLGAVVERTLMTLRTDPLARSALIASSRTLANTGHPYLVSIAATTSAHQPGTAYCAPDAADDANDQQSCLSAQNRSAACDPDPRSPASSACTSADHEVPALPTNSTRTEQTAAMRAMGSGTFHGILTPPDPAPNMSSISTRGSSAPELTDAARRIATAEQLLHERQRALEHATNAAYHAIRAHVGSSNDTRVGRVVLGVSRSTFYRLKAGANWAIPAARLCADIDRVGRTIGHTFGLTDLLESVNDAREWVTDSKYSRH